MIHVLFITIWAKQSHNSSITIKFCMFNVDPIAHCSFFWEPMFSVMISRLIPNCFICFSLTTFITNIFSYVLHPLSFRIITSLYNSSLKLDVTPIIYKQAAHLQLFHKLGLPDLKSKFYNHLHLSQADTLDR